MRAVAVERELARARRPHAEARVAAGGREGTERRLPGKVRAGEHRADSTRARPDTRSTPQLRALSRVRGFDMRLILATILTLALLPGAAAAQAPAVTTGPPEAVEATTATLTGTVDPERPAAGLPLRVRHDDGVRASRRLAADQRGARRREAVSAALTGPRGRRRRTTTGSWRATSRATTAPSRPLAAPTPPSISRLRASSGRRRRAAVGAGRPDAALPPRGTWSGARRRASATARRPVAARGRRRGARLARARPGCRRTGGSTGASSPRTRRESAAAAARASPRRAHPAA